MGYQDLESKTPMRTDSIFQIMSKSKPITGVGVMILGDDGLLALSDTVEKHLPEYRGKLSWCPIAIRDLMRCNSPATPA